MAAVYPVTGDEELNGEIFYLAQGANTAYLRLNLAPASACWLI